MSTGLIIKNALEYYFNSCGNNEVKKELQV
jgi:hypothetical protein